VANQWWELEIRDHGCGFNDDDLERDVLRAFDAAILPVRSHRAGSGLWFWRSSGRSRSPTRGTGCAGDRRGGGRGDSELESAQG